MVYDSVAKLAISTETIKLNAIYFDLLPFYTPPQTLSKALLEREKQLNEITKNNINNDYRRSNHIKLKPSSIGLST